nr:DUF1566 domain-containing protein [uncultured Undibacterium sp.]
MKIVSFILVTVCMLVVAPAHAQRYSYSADGSEVTDSQTGLTWSRCIEGMSWNGTTCAGSRILFSQVQAQARAKAKVGGWRLPSVKELSSIVDRSRISPAIDIVAFPATPTTFSPTRTSTPNVTKVGWPMYVDFDDGFIGSVPNTSPYNVRLVKK